VDWPEASEASSWCIAAVPENKVGHPLFSSERTLFERGCRTTYFELQRPSTSDDGGDLLAFATVNLDATVACVQSFEISVLRWDLRSLVLVRVFVRLGDSIKYILILLISTKYTM
jgi:hypothetical protein